MPEPLADRWHDRDLPVLIEIARLIEDGKHVLQDTVRDTLPELGELDVQSAFRALKPTYVEDIPRSTDTRAIAWHGWPSLRLTERGRRAVGLWPREDAAADALVDLLNQAADTTTDEDDAGALRKAGRLLKSVPGNVLSDVTAALIRQQAGL